MDALKSVKGLELTPLVFIILYCVCSMSSFSQSINVNELRQGWQLYKIKQYPQAAQVWSRKSETILEQSRGKDALRLAALAKILSAVAYEKEENYQAYQEWAIAQTFLLESNIRWPDFQRIIEQDYERELNLLNQASSGLVQLGVSLLESESQQSSLLLLEIERELSLSRYEGPEPGLSDENSQSAGSLIVVDTPIPQRSYVARPAEVAIPDTPLEDIEEAGASRASLAGEAESDAANTNDTNIIVQPISRAEQLPPLVATTPPSLPSTNDSEQSVLVDAGVVDEAETNEVISANTAELSDLSGDAAGDVSANVLANNSSLTLPEITPTNSRTSAVKPIVEGSNEDSSDDSSNEAANIALAPNVEVTASATQGNVTTAAIEQPRIPLGIRGLVSANLVENSHNRDIAQKAWQYFNHNVDSQTGLAYDTHEYPYTTMWGTGSYLSALVSSHKLGIINQQTFNRRMRLVLNSLNRIPFYNQEVPNRQYRADTLSLIDMSNKVSENGSGWSAIGIGRLLIWLKIVANWYPDYTIEIERFVRRLDFTRLLKNGELNGAFHDGIAETLFNEGRFGYEQYAAMGYKLWGYNVDNALNYDTIIFKRLYEIDVPMDSRIGAHLVSDPFLLAAMEFTLIDLDFSRYTQKIYQVQKQHSLAIKQPVAQTEISFNKTPWFAYYSILDNEKPWQVVSFDGSSHNDYSGFSTHGLFMFDAVFSDEHSRLMMRNALSLASDNFGYYAGKTYKGNIIRGLSSHTNGAILQSLLFNKLNEPFLSQDIQVAQQ